MYNFTYYTTPTSILHLMSLNRNQKIENLFKLIKVGRFCSEFSSLLELIAWLLKDCVKYLEVIRLYNSIYNLVMNNININLVMPSN